MEMYLQPTLVALVQQSVQCVCVSGQ